MFQRWRRANRNTKLSAAERGERSALKSRAALRIDRLLLLSLKTSHFFCAKKKKKANLQLYGPASFSVARGYFCLRTSNPGQVYDRAR